MTVRWALIGPGSFAGYVVVDLQAAAGADVVSVCSRHLERAAEFAGRHGIGSWTDDYDALLATDGIDAVYIATPHPSHYPLGRRALEAGKHVLSEKAFALTAAEARDYVAVAHRSGRFLMEAMWSRFGPVAERIGELVTGGAVGDVRLVRSQLGVRRPYSSTDRWWDPDQGGGALLELGVYPISFVTAVLGPPDDVVARGTATSDGVDIESTALLSWSNGAQAVVSCSLLVDQSGASVIAGTGGSIETDPPVYALERLTHTPADGEPTIHVPPIEGHGYVPMFRHATRCIEEGLGESPVMTHDVSIQNMEVVDAIRAGLTVTSSRP